MRELPVPSRGRCRILPRPGPGLLEPAEPVLHVMGADDPAVCDLVEVVRPDLGLAAGRRDAEELAGLDAVHRGAHADHSVSVVAARVDDLLDDEAEVAEGLAEPFDQGPRPGAAGLLAAPQRDVVPVVGDDCVEQVRLAAGGLVEGTDEIVDGCRRDRFWLMRLAGLA